MKNDLNAMQVYNMDETGLSPVPKKIGKMISMKGKNQVGALASAERAKLITAVPCFSAARHYVPPTIFPRESKNEKLTSRRWSTV